MKIIGIITGVLITILGGYAMCVPLRTFLGIGWLLGIIMLVSGIEILVLEFSKKKKDAWQILIGVLETIGGGFLLFSGIQRMITDVMVVYIIGIVITFYGAFQIISVCKEYKEAKGNSILKIILGVLSVIAGILVLSHPFITMVSVGYLIAASLFFQGINTIVVAAGFSNSKKAAENAQTDGK